LRSAAPVEQWRILEVVDDWAVAHEFLPFNELSIADPGYTCHPTVGVEQRIATCFPKIGKQKINPSPFRSKQQTVVAFDLDARPDNGRPCFLRSLFCAFLMGLFAGTQSDPNSHGAIGPVANCLPHERTTFHTKKIKHLIIF